MEQHRTRPSQHRTRRTAPLPPQAGPRGSVASYRAAATTGRSGVSSLVRRLRRFPNPRLTGLGGGLFCVLSMLLVGWLDQVLFDGSAGVYGVMFVLVSALTAVWVRRADLVTAPICVPIAFAAGAVPVADRGDGIGGQVVGVFTVLALQAGWLYGGTLVAALIVAGRKVRLMARRAAQRRVAAQEARARGARAPRPRRRPV